MTAKGKSRPVRPRKARTSTAMIPNSAAKLINNMNERLTAQTSIITLATTNPTLCDETFRTVPRYNDVYRVEATEVYHVHDNPTAKVLFPQAQLNYTQLTGTGPVTASVPAPSKIPIGQFLTLYQNSLMCRMIQSFKNSTMGYWCYQLLNSSGNFNFRSSVAGGAPAINQPFSSATTTLRPSGMVYPAFGQLLSVATADQAAAQGLFGNFAAGDLGFISTIAAAGVPRDGPTNISSGFYYGDRDYVYADAAPSNPGFVYNIGGTQIGGTNSASVAQVGQFLTGCFIFYWTVLPSMAATKQLAVTVQMLGYNEQEEVQYTSAHSLISTVQLINGTSFAAIPTGFDDYYTFVISMTSNDPAVQNEASFGILYIGTGEGWAHLPTFQVDTVQNEIEGSGWVATTGLATNTTAPLTRGALQAGLQPPNKVEWQSLVNAKDPFEAITSKFGAKALPFDRGGYAWLRPTDDEDYRLKEEIVDASTIASGVTRQNIYRTRLDNQPFMAHCINNDNLSQPQSILFTFDQTGEFSTDTLWRHPEYSEWNQSAWKAAAEALKHVPQLTINDKHDYITTIGSGIGVSQGTIDSVKKWIAKLLPIGQAAITALLAA